MSRTNDEPGAKGVRLLLVETGTPGFQRGRKLDKIGCRAQETSELFFAGGWGYMTEYPIARAFVDARMKHIVGRSLFR